MIGRVAVAMLATVECAGLQLRWLSIHGETGRRIDCAFLARGHRNLGM